VAPMDSLLDAWHITPQFKCCSIEQAAIKLGVSTATVRNWVKAGHLNPTTHRPIAFNETDVLALREAIRSGDIARLRGRANKSKSSVTSVPHEYAVANKTLGLTASLVDFFTVGQNRVDISAAIFLIALRILELHGEVQASDREIVTDLGGFHSWKRASVRAEMSDWLSTISLPNSGRNYQELSKLLRTSTDEDILGLTYQSLSHEGEKSTKGSYYTPKAIVEESLKHSTGSVSTFLDPCCGTGQYLICAAKAFGLALSNVFGFDIDDLAVRISRINLLLQFPHEDTRPNVECLNTITELATGEVFCATNHLIGAIDFIATNPPWGAYKNKHLPDHLTNGIRSNEAFSLVLARSIALLRDGGRLSFILPESILNIRAHADIREIILACTHVTRIAHLGRQFSGVFTPVVRLDLVKEGSKKGAAVLIESQAGSHCVDQRRFTENRDFAFDVQVTDVEDGILRKIFGGDSFTLKGNALWALGIVTGNNKEFIRDQPGCNLEAIYKGSDISPFTVNPASNYIRFNPGSFQQVAKIEFYRAPVKLIYKFISNRLVFAYDDCQRLTLNSANILIPKIPDINAKTALAFLNSNVFQYVLRGDLETIPFAKIGQEASYKIGRLVDRVLAGESVLRELNLLIYKAYGVDENEIKQIEAALN
jgi:SAM-dependent methyltransferase